MFDELYGLVGLFVTMYAIFAIIGVAVMVAMYILYCFPQKAIANKLGIFDNWMAYVPVARSVQKTRIAEMSTWKFMFLGSFTPGLVMGLAILLSSLFMMVSFGFGMFFMIVSIIFISVMNFICNYQYNHRLCKIFGFNTFLAFAMLFIPIYMTIFTFLVVYPEQFEGNKDKLFTNGGQPQSQSPSESYTYGGTMGQRSVQTRIDFNPGIVGKRGYYAGQTLSFANGERIVLGRDKNSCSVIFSSECTKISRVHCAIRYDSNQGGYIIEDYSSNGTYINGQRLNSGAPFKAVSGSTIDLGNEENSFYFV